LGFVKNPRINGSLEALGVIGLQPLGRLENRLSFGDFGAIEERGFCRIFCPFAFFLPLFFFYWFFFMF